MLRVTNVGLRFGDKELFKEMYFTGETPLWDTCN